MELVFVLVEPSRPANVGAAARALTTMGIRHLRVVNSRAHLEDEARWVAHGAHQLLDSIEQFEQLELAIADCDLVVATTARRRGCKRSYWSPQQLLPILEHKQTSLSKVAVLFGCEESGLPNSIIDQADLLSAIPLAQPQPSLNLAQAVMIYSYALSELIGEKKTPVADENEWRALRDKLGRLLALLQDDPKLSEWIQDRSGLLDQRDIRMAHTLLNDLLNRLE